MSVPTVPQTQPIPPGRAALIVIDITQDSLLPPDVSGIALDGAPEAVANARRLVAGGARRGPARHLHPGAAPARRRGLRARIGRGGGRPLPGRRARHAVPAGPPPLPGEYYVPKRRYSAFFGTDLEILLKGLRVKTLILVGLLTDVCVHYTGADAHQHDYHIRVVRECVAGSSAAAHEASLNALEYLQTGAVLALPALLAALAESPAARGKDASAP